MNNIPRRIAIIGVGLIGGSIALGLKQHLGTNIEIFGCCSSLLHSKKAKNEGIIDAVFDLNNINQNIKLIIIATPILKIPGILKKLSKIINNALIIDTASTKEFIVDSASKILPKNISLIGTHPMAGSETSGFENADPNLFRNKPWIVCNHQSSIRQPTDYQLAILNQLISLLGAKAIFMEAKIHDKLAAAASHLNLVTASILVNSVSKSGDWKDVAQIASTGFRDTTRLASSDVVMRRDIILTNGKNIVASLKDLENEIKILKSMIIKNNTKDIVNYLSKAKTTRDNWITNYFS